jgi:hypothetical protein
MVRCIFVPVSPSGTGNTLSAFTSQRAVQTKLLPLAAVQQCWAIADVVLLRIHRASERLVDFKFSDLRVCITVALYHQALTRFEYPGHARLRLIRASPTTD